MELVNERDIEPLHVDGDRGSVDVYDALSGPVVAGVRIVAPHSRVPRSPHSHPERQLIYVISGTAQITNGAETLQLRPGDHVLLEANEEHYVITADAPVKLFEVRY